MLIIYFSSTLTKHNTTLIKTALRIRPLTRADKVQPRFSQCTDSDVLKTFENTVAVIPHQKSFQFDYVFDYTSSQEQVFTSVVSNLLDRFMDGNFKTFSIPINWLLFFFMIIIANSIKLLYTVFT
jgi:hypothetical protein